MQLTMAQFGAVTSAPIGAESTVRVLEAWLTRRPLEAHRLMVAAGMSGVEAGAVITALGRGTDRREWRR